MIGKLKTAFRRLFYYSSRQLLRRRRTYLTVFVSSIALLTVVALQLLWYVFDLIQMIADRNPFVILWLLFTAAVVYGLYRGVFYVLTHQEELIQKLLPY